MMAIRFGTVQKVTTLVPLALVSTAWTANLAGYGGGLAAAPPLPDGTAVPTQALEDPASYSVPGTLGLGIKEGDTGNVIATASTNGIPSAALAAYQRAETVINAADQACNIDWQLIAAIGRVESDHGRYGGNTLGIDGISRPGIIGIPLNGSNNTQAIPDTDAGQYDRDTVWDRAVGPMQFIPSTWSAVGVDADGDGKRNPQDIDDAALAAAVYLCSGTDDLGTDAGRRAAVFRYNHSEAYVRLVLAIREAYLQGDYTAVPNYTTSAITFTPDFSWTPPKSTTIGQPPTYTPPGGFQPPGSGTGGGGGGGNNPPTNDDDDDPTTPPPPPPPGGDVGKITDQLGDTVGDVVEPLPPVVEDPVTNVVNGLLGALDPVVARTLCETTYLLRPAKKQECLASYGL